MVRVADADLEVLDLPGTLAADPLVHSGAGSVTGWGAFPQQLASWTERRIVAYSRRGHGSSSPLTSPPRADFMQIEARTVLPALLDQLNIPRCAMLGHSDGGSIAVVFAAEHPQRVSALLLLAAHFFVEDVTLQGIREAGRRYRESGPSRALLAQHRDPAGAFAAWHDAWLANEFRSLDLRPDLQRVRCPVLAVQGADDEYGTRAQLEAVSANVHESVSTWLVPGGHFPHRQAAELTRQAITEFLAGGPPRAAGGPPRGRGPHGLSAPPRA